MHKGGCDCLGLLIGVAQELALRSSGSQHLLAWFDENSYGHYPDETHLRRRLDALLTAVEIQEVIPGDVLLFRIDESARHLAIVSDYPPGGSGLGIIHAYAPARAVVEHRLDECWKKRIVAVYRLPPDCIS